MNAYVEVPAARLFPMLEGAGFKAGSMGREVMYTRVHDRDPRLTVDVLTSVPVNATGARDCGQDAIRVSAWFTWYVRGEQRRKRLHSAKILRVNSVEGVLERTINAAREAYQACNEYRKTL